MKRRKTVWVKPLSMAVPRNSIFPASARGKYRLSGNYGRFGADGEMKFIDNLLAFNVIASAGEIRPDTSDTVTPAVAVSATGTLVQVVQGDQTYQRNGRKITVKRINARLTLNLPASTVATEASDTYRIMLVQDKQCNGAAATVASVLGFTGQTITAHSFNNLENSRRFRVLFDVFRPINASAGGAPTATPSFSQTNHTLVFNKKCNIPIEYDSSATTGAIATIRSNNLFILAISQGQFVRLTGNVRLRYSDN